MTASTLLDSLASFVPALILRRLAADPAVLAAPVAEQFPAAVLSADLTGFTPLAERLAHNGPDGAEELTRLLNTYFGQLIELITSHGGDVAEFAGDALLAVWPAEPEDEKTSPFSPLSAAVCRAARCGLAVQSLLHNYQVAEGVRLSMRIGIGAGTVWAMHAGGVYGRWKLLLNGAPLAQVSMAERQAEPGQVILSPEAWQTLAEKECGIEHVSSLATGCVRLDAINESPPLRAACLPVLAHDAEAGLRAYLPNAIISRLALGQDTSRAQPQSEWLAELRRVTVLFINLTDSSFNFTHGDTLSLERVHLIMRVLQATLYRYEGTFNKISVNDKGATVVAALGLPPLAHEDDAARGVQVALAAQAELRRLGVCSAIGVTTGRAFCGSVGNDTRREYTIIGDVVNLASRLMNAARVATYGDGRISGAADDLLILTDAATYQATQRRIAFDSLSAIKVKGKRSWWPFIAPSQNDRRPSPRHTNSQPRLSDGRLSRYCWPNECRAYCTANPAV